MKRLLLLSTLCALLLASCTAEPIVINEQIEDYYTTPLTRSLTNNTNSDSQIDHSINERYIPKGEPTLIALPNGGQVYFDPVDSVYFSGDMLFSTEFIESISTNARSAVSKATNFYWPNKTIPYFISPNIPTTQKNNIYQAIEHIENVTYLNFIEQTTAGSNRIIFSPISGDTSFSYVGKQSTRPNSITLSNDADSGIIIHEILHSLGLFHEHCRTDRDNYITIHYDRIDPKYTYAFDKYIDSYTDGGYDIGVFDFNSIMLYGSISFPIDPDNPEPTITKKDNSIFFAQRTSLSNGDIRALNYIYGPKPQLITTETYYEHDTSSQTRDELATYSNTLIFVDKFNNPITLEYPRLIWVHLQTEESLINGEIITYTNTTKLSIPAGTSSYPLGETRYIRQDEMGNTRYYCRSYYDITFY